MFEEIVKQASTVLASAEPQQVSDATRDHVQNTDPATLASHLSSGAQQLDTGSLAALGQSLLAALAKHGHDETQANDGGVDTSAAGNGDRDNVVGLVQHAQQHPEALRDAAVAFVERDPQVLARLPGMVEGVLSRLRG